jgi:hypothetical protein
MDGHWYFLHEVYLLAVIFREDTEGDISSE